MTDLAHYITDYGYWALFIGCLAEEKPSRCWAASPPMKACCTGRG